MSRTTFYDLVSPLYPMVDLFLAPQKRAMCEEIRAFAPELLLEIGAGNGSHRQSLHGTRSIGVDLSRRMLRSALRQNPSTFSALLADGLRLPLADSCVDAVVLSHVASVVSDPVQLLAESHRVLRAGGRLWILNHFTPSSWVGAFDRMVRPLGPILGLNTVFRTEDLSEGLSAFTPLDNRSIGAFSYYRLLTLAKP